jgi:hypothetical protein
MAIKMPKPDEIVVKLRQVEVLMGQGMLRIDAIKQISVTEQTYYRWTSVASQCHWFERDAERTVEWTSSNSKNRNGYRKRASPSRRRASIDHVRNQFKVSERRVSRILGQHRSTQR